MSRKTAAHEHLLRAAFCCSDREYSDFRIRPSEGGSFLREDENASRKAGISLSFVHLTKLLKNGRSCTDYLSVKIKMFFPDSTFRGRIFCFFAGSLKGGYSCFETVSTERSEKPWLVFAWQSAISHRLSVM